MLPLLSLCLSQGGLPAWLLRKPNIHLRTSDPGELKEKKFNKEKKQTMTKWVIWVPKTEETIPKLEIIHSNIY